MAIYPKAIWKPIPLKGRRSITVYNRMNLHVAVSETTSLFSFFSKVGVDSHFYVRKDGTVEQYVDTSLRANADLEGNDATISVETQGGLKNASGEPWTDAQCKALAELFAWSVKTHGLKVQIASSSKIGEESKGLSWHRLGINGNFPALPSVLAGRNQRGGGMYYSRATGKACPGDSKIKQIQTIFEMAKKIINGSSSENNSNSPSKPSSSSSKSSVNYTVKIKGTNELNIRVGPSVKYEISGVIKDQKLYTIVEEKNGWGRLKSGAGWISLAYTTKSSNNSKTSSSSKPSVSSSNSSVVVLRKGSNGKAVGDLQKGLNKAFPAYSKLVVDNAFGPATEKVVKEFQRRTGLKVDGIVGPATQAKLKTYGINL